MYAVTIEPDNRLMRITVHGFWPEDVIPAYVAELQRQTAALEPAGGCRRILVDMSDYPIQSQAVAEAHARIIIFGKNTLRSATAVVMTSALSKLQAKRMANLAGHELFGDVRSARAWLMSQAVVSMGDRAA